MTLKLCVYVATPIVDFMGFNVLNAWMNSKEIIPKKNYLRSLIIYKSARNRSKKLLFR